MTQNCSEVIFSDKAYNELIRESFAMDPVETGGILLGYVVNSTWVVMEVVPPGYKNSIHQRAYFEYDQEFVNYLIPSISNSYKDPLQLLGLWHRHPGSMDYFSSTDDETNAEFAQRSKIGTLSGLVNIDPSFRLTMYHLDHFVGRRPKDVAYSRVNVEVGDDLIPEEFFALRYVDDKRSELHPTPTHTNTKVAHTHSVPKSPRNGSDDEIDITDKNKSRVIEPAHESSVIVKKRGSRKNVKLIFMATIAVILFFVGAIIGKMIPQKEEANADEKTQSLTEKPSDLTPGHKPLLDAIASTWSIKYFPYIGTFVEGDSTYNVTLDFILSNNGIDEAIYTNSKYKGKIKMKVECPDDNSCTLRGRDGNKDFTIELKSSDPNELTGTASVGEQEFKVSLTHIKHPSDDKN